MKKIVIFGKNGQIGSALCELFDKEKNYITAYYSSKEADFSNLKSLNNFLNNFKETPDYIINAAAYTNVDKAEEDKSLSDMVNHKAVGVLANYCYKNNCTLIHYSTDYVFDGSGSDPFEEDSKKNLKPLNHYGKTKLDGEKAIINSRCNYIILRTSWVWSEDGKNFVITIKKLAKEKDCISVVSDQIGSPTFASDIAYNTMQIIDHLTSNNNIELQKGIYHATSHNYVSWHNFATRIISIMQERGIPIKINKIIPIKTCDYKTKAKRPLNSRMKSNKLQKNFSIQIKDWEESLKNTIN